jgi:hypothetical protein
VTRWCEANPDKAGTGKDVVKRMRRRVEALQREVGVRSGEEVLVGNMTIVLLMVKKRADVE